MLSFPIYAVLAALIQLGLAYHHHIRGDHSGNQTAVNEIHKAIFTPDYNLNVRPYVEALNGTTEVRLELSELQLLEDDMGRLSFRFLFRQDWVDPRLEYNASLYNGVSSIRMKDCDKILWVPDLYFENVIHQSPSEHGSSRLCIRITSSGYVVFKQRLTQTFLCPELLKFNRGMDEKNITCQTAIKSFGYKSDELQLLYDAIEPIKNNNRDTVSLRWFNYEGASFSVCSEEQKHNADGHACLSLSLKLSVK